VAAAAAQVPAVRRGFCLEQFIGQRGANRAGLYAVLPGKLPHPTSPGLSVLGEVVQDPLRELADVAVGVVPGDGQQLCPDLLADAGFQRSG
jgi:hypothetical protein